MKKVLSFLLMLICISCKASTTNTESAYSLVPDEIYGLYDSSCIDGINVVESTNTDDVNGENYPIKDDYDGGVYSNTDDMIAMYYGNKSRLKWGKAELKKVVTHTFKDGHKDWFFSTFLYLEFKNDEGLKFGDNQPGYNGPASKEHWEWLLNRYFSNAYNYGNYEGLKALDECIGDFKKELGEPTFKHKVVLGIPSPCTNFTEWGSIKKNGKTIKLDFRNKNHKQEAVKWFIDELIKRFEAQHYKNITLEGLYWVEESTSMTSWHKDNKSGRWTNKKNDRDKYDYVFDTKAKKHNDVVAYACDYVHIKGLKFYWIPYNGAYGSDKWKDIGFDRCDTQTGYFWGTPDLLRNPRTLKTISDLRNICDAALKDDKGLEFEVSADLFVPCYAKLKNKRDIERPYDIIKVADCNKTPREMKALGYNRFNFNPCLLARLENLMDIFEEQGVFDRSNITYYFDNSAILDLCNSTEKDIITLVDRLARHISQRKK